MLVAAARLTFNAVVSFWERINLYFCFFVSFTLRSLLPEIYHQIGRSDDSTIAF
ncbi:hypothetical protein H6F77_14850 [Microcoleus sp. FACHB-831]|uniref:hypothetical protein n=1 Tax=Microcoleus sp. FACHB-831 TaxID=2692827 RepID=UPI001682C51C|nr:hypothetical protein [Microcoleus sp. FACHB-831]MBD1922353.1 hypothetical protein [Microcoleus sp. FACHB-831]